MRFPNGADPIPIHRQSGVCDLHDGNRDYDALHTHAQRFNAHSLAHAVLGDASSTRARRRWAHTILRTVERDDPLACFARAERPAPSGDGPTHR